MSYRDELAAAQARADALQRRVKELEREKAALEARQPEPAAPIVIREPAPPPVVIRAPAPQTFEDEHPGMALFSKASGGGGLCLLIAGLFGGALWATLTGLVLLAIFVAGYVAWNQRRSLAAAPPERPPLPAGVLGAEVTSGGLRVTAEARVRAGDPTAARYDGAPDEEIERLLGAALAGEVARGTDELEWRLRDHLEPLGLDLIAVRLAAVGSGPVDPSDRP
jgi:hypothetical protein